MTTVTKCTLASNAFWSFLVARILQMGKGAKGRNKQSYGPVSSGNEEVCLCRNGLMMVAVLRGQRRFCLGEIEKRQGGTMRTATSRNRAHRRVLSSIAMLVFVFGLAVGFQAVGVNHGTPTAVAQQPGNGNGNGNGYGATGAANGNAGGNGVGATGVGNANGNANGNAPGNGVGVGIGSNAGGNANGSANAGAGGISVTGTSNGVGNVTGTTSCPTPSGTNPCTPNPGGGPCSPAALVNGPCGNLVPACTNLNGAAPEQNPHCVGDQNTVSTTTGGTVSTGTTTVTVPSTNTSVTIPGTNTSVTIPGANTSTVVTSPSTTTVSTVPETTFSAAPAAGIA